MRALLALLMAAQPAADALLARIRQKMADNLARLPNYTCEETIERSVRERSSRRFQPVDKLRLEVAYVGGKELFSWPGGDKFEDKAIGEFVGGGTIGNGDFALHARTLFQTKAPIFTGGGEESAGGRKLVRYDFRVPRAANRFLIRSGAVEDTVGYRGSFWVDAESLDLLRIEIEADDIPPTLQTSQARDIMVYGRARIGESDFLLPRSSELSMVDSEGTESRNRQQFSACRQYTGQSVISFADPASTAEPAKPIVPLELPADLQLDISLNTGIRGDKVARGDPISGTVVHEVRKAGAVTVPKGALLKGRVTRVMHRRTPRLDQYGVGIRFNTLEFGNYRVEFRGELQDLRLVGTQIAVAGSTGDALDPGEGILLMRGQLRIPAGLLMVWRTLQ